MIREKISELEIDKILSNNDLRKNYLNKLAKAKGMNIKTRKNKADLNDMIMKTWEYSLSKDIIREIYFESEKCENAFECAKKIKTALEDWDKLKLGDFEWPFSASNFDKRVVAINRMNVTEEKKDDILSKETIKFRRIKDINTLRNDYIEYLITKKNENIMPTLKHKSGVDFYIDGYPYD